jgi:glycerophosphoryl diester phosphodiesterase
MTFPNPPFILAHRGYAARAPENTLASFRMAQEAGAGGIELDVHRCAGGEVTVIHDHSLKRTAGLDALVEATAWESIRELDAGSWFGPSFRDERVPLLRQVFEAFGDRLFYDVEIKSSPDHVGPLEQAVASEIQRHGLGHRCFVSSFNPLSIRRVAKANRAIETAVLYADSPGMPFWLRRGQGRFISGSRILKPHHTQVTGRFMARYSRRLGYRVVPWTVDDPVEARRLADLGVDGIITNDPLVVMDAIGR